MNTRPVLNPRTPVTLAKVSRVTAIGAPSCRTGGRVAALCARSEPAARTAQSTREAWLARLARIPSNVVTLDVVIPRAPDALTSFCVRPLFERCDPRRVCSGRIPRAARTPGGFSWSVLDRYFSLNYSNRRDDEPRVVDRDGIA